ncbi:MAG: shikimate dehydrogenase [Actinomycetota bacterium]
MSELPVRPGRVRGSTRKVGVIGWPVEHSLSPVIHNSAFVALGMDWVYVPLPVGAPQLTAALEGLVALGFAGANVTMPHKTRTAEMIDDLSEDARILRAVNTIVVGPEGLSGHNSDALGFERFLREDAGFDPAGRTALVFGAGGGARACALALSRGGLGTLAVAVREPSRAEDLRVALEGSGTEVRVVTFDEVPSLEADLVVNATPLGVHGEPLPLPRPAPGVVGVDLLYRPSATPFQSALRGTGGAVFGGLGLLLQQAAISFELWTGRSAPLPVMSAAALGELAEAGPSGGS